MTPKNDSQVMADENGNNKIDANGNVEKQPDSVEDDSETSELAKLRCPSLQTEEIASQARAKAEREERRRSRQNRSADYPGLAFGSAGMFGSDTMMKFSIIKNELHNIMRSQLKRVDGEVTAMAGRVKSLDEGLEESERRIREATEALAEAVKEHAENARDEEEGECALSQFDAQMKLLEGKMAQAKSLAEEAHILAGNGDGDSSLESGKK